MPSFFKARAGFHSASEFVAGRAIACGTQVVVPVLRIGARIAGADDASASGFGGSCSADLLGALVKSADGRTQWLTTQPSPPGDAQEWSDWLADQPALQTEIERATRSLESEG